MKKRVYPASNRGHADYGWLKTYYSFSFANWYNPEQIHFGRLRVLNDDTIAPDSGFGTHPHDNMEIITIPLEGELTHMDSMGHSQIIRPDEVQVMSAGTGITHSEYNSSNTNHCKLFQIWIFPDEKNLKPRYEQKLFSADDRINAFQLLVSPFNHQEGLHIHQDAYISRILIDSGLEKEYSLFNHDNGIFVFLIDGQIHLENHTLNERDAIGIFETNSVKLLANQKSDILIIEVPMA